MQREKPVSVTAALFMSKCSLFFSDNRSNPSCQRVFPSTKKPRRKGAPAGEPQTFTNRFAGRMITVGVPPGVRRPFGFDPAPAAE